MTIRPKPITLEMVAARAGVARGTASKAFSDRFPISPATRRRVIEAAEELGFLHNEIARSLAMGRSGAVGMLVSDLAGALALPVMLGAERELSRDADASILLSNAGGDLETETRRARSLLARQVDGLFVVGAGANPRAPLRGPIPVPVVYLLAPSTALADTSVIVDDEHAGRLAAEHLLERGAERVVFVGGAESEQETHARLAGVEAALAARDLTLVVPPRFGGWSHGPARAQIQDLRDVGIAFDGVVGASDAAAAGALTGLAGAGLRVPTDVRVVGIDNAPAIAELTEPALSSVDLNLGHLGRVAADLLVELQQGRDRPGITSVPCFLHKRASS